MELRKKLRCGATDIFNLIYPDSCAGCDSQISYGKKFLCLKCEITLPYNLMNDEHERFWGKVKVENVFSLLDFKKENIVKSIIHKIKYKNKINLGQHMGRKIGFYLKQENWSKKIDLIVPLPLHKKKFNERGYNQSSYLAKGIADVINKPVNEKIIVRQTANMSQTKKSRYERWKNVKNIFTIKNKLKIENKHILLIDDTITTGSTLESCVRSIKEKVNCKISISSLAIAR